MTVVRHRSNSSSHEWLDERLSQYHPMTDWREDGAASAEPAV